MGLTKPIPFNEAVLKTRVAQLCDHVGFHAITQDSSNILVDLYRRTICQLARHCKESANSNRRTEATIVDLVQACEFVGIPILEMQEYIETTKLPFPFPITKDEDDRPPNRVHRDVHIDDLLEAQKSSNSEEVDPGENKALSESGLDEDEKPPVKLMKDIFTEIASKFDNFTPVSADKKIRLGGRIVILPGTKLKITAPLLPDPEPDKQSQSTDILPKIPKEPKQKAIKREAGKKQTSKKEAGKKKASKKKVKSSAVTPLDPSAAEPPSFLPLLEPKVEPQEPSVIEPETSSPILPNPEPDILPQSVDILPKVPKESKKKAPKKQKLKVPKEPKQKALKKKASKKKSKNPDITPLDPSAAKPPSFLPLLEPKLELLKLETDVYDLPSPAREDVPVLQVQDQHVARLTPINEPPFAPQATPPTSTQPTIKQQKSKKKKKKSSDSQFAIVTETVTQTDEKEWFCPACGGPDDGDLMVQCDVCQEWYHLGCTDLKKPPEENENWDCNQCINKAKAQKKRPPSGMEVVKIEAPPPPKEVKHTPTPPPASDQPVTAPHAGTSQDDLCPECNLPDNGTLMIQCDDPFCAKWFHGKCVSLLEPPRSDESWFCKVCVEKQASAFKRRRKAK